jgi:hypothetical protein
MVRQSALPQDLEIEVEMQLHVQVASTIVKPDGSAMLEFRGIPIGLQQYQISWRIPALVCREIDGRPVTLGRLAGQVNVQDGVNTVSPLASDIDTKVDTDGDTYTNLAEIKAGSDPCNRRSIPPIDFPDFTTGNGLRLVDKAQRAGNVLRITPADRNQDGAVWFERSKQFVVDGFTTTFQLRITELAGVRHLGDNTIGADGLAFVLRNTLVDPVQGYGGAGLGNSLAVEFDTWWNDPALQGFEDRHDPNGNHISVQTRGTAPNSADHQYSRGSTTAIPNLSDGNIHTVTITYVPGTMRIFLDNPVTPVLEVAIDISTILSLDDGSAFVGFVASTGSSWENHDILRWSFRGSR